MSSSRPQAESQRLELEQPLAVGGLTGRRSPARGARRGPPEAHGRHGYRSETARDLARGAGPGARPPLPRPAARRGQPLEVDPTRADAGVPGRPGCTAHDEHPLLQARVHPLRPAQERDPVEELARSRSRATGPATTGAPVRCSARLRTRRTARRRRLARGPRSRRRAALRPANRANGASGQPDDRRQRGAEVRHRSRRRRPISSIDSTTSSLAERSSPSGRTNRSGSARCGRRRSRPRSDSSSCSACSSKVRPM